MGFVELSMWVVVMGSFSFEVDPLLLIFVILKQQVFLLQFFAPWLVKLFQLHSQLL
jgi:hypothetical protein